MFYIAYTPHYSYSTDNFDREAFFVFLKHCVAQSSVHCYDAKNKITTH